MEKFFILIIEVFGIIIVYLISKYRKVMQKNRVNALAAHTILENSSTAYIINEQSNLLEEYRITEKDDWEMAKKILSSFQKYMNELLLTDGLTLPKTKHVISEKDFFMFSLMLYLEEHQCDYSFIGYNMHEETISRKDYGSWGGSLYDATYSLTKFAVVFNKLYYISYCYCKNSKTFNPDGIYYKYENNIEDIIDSKIISISQI